MVLFLSAVVVVLPVFIIFAYWKYKYHSERAEHYDKLAKEAQKLYEEKRLVEMSDHRN